MSNNLTPTVEKVNVREASIKLSAEMLLASVPVRVSGTYNIHNNTFYPYTVVEIDENGYEIGDHDSDDLEHFCEVMGWDYFDTHDAIQEAVEKRDQ